MKKSIIFIAVILVACACSQYSVKTEKKIRSVLSQLQSSGVIVRLPSGAMIKIEEYVNTLSYWLEGYTHHNTLEMIKPGNDNIFYSFSDYDRFYQMSTRDEFLTYKSIGVISIFLRQNKEELRKIMTEKKLDSLIIFEIDSSYTLEMQFYDFDTTLVVIDSNFNIVYLDHQSNVYDIDEMDSELVRRDLIDKICGRFTKSMFEFDYISKRKDSIQPQKKAKAEPVKKVEDEAKVKSAEPSKGTSEVKTVDEPKPAEGPKSAEPEIKVKDEAGVKSAEPAKGASEVKTVDEPKPAEGSKSAEPEIKVEDEAKVKSAEPAKGTSEVKTVDEPKPAEASPASVPEKK